jgi:RNA polymerase sigma-70 factor (ECF subfamily)
MSTHTITGMIEPELGTACMADGMSGYDGIYRRYYRTVYSICLRMTGNVHDTEDLVQEVFVLLARKLATFRGEATFATWLHRLTVNTVLAHYRKRRARREDSLESASGSALDKARLGRSRVITELDRIALGTAIESLPCGYRTTLLLHDLEGYEHTEIARILGCGVGTSKSQLHKARRRMRQLLGGRE